MLSTKDEVLSKFKPMMAKIIALKRTSGRIVIRIDGGESNSTAFKEYCRNQGWQIQVTTPHCSYQNGGVERYFQTLFSLARANMHQCNCPRTLWGEAVKYVNILHNNLPSIRDSSKTPFELLGWDQLSVDKFHVFGSIAYVGVPAGSRKAGEKHLGPRALKMYYIGPDEDSKADRFL